MHLDRRTVSRTVFTFAAAIVACAGQTNSTPPVNAPPASAGAEDRELWKRFAQDRTKIRCAITYTSTGVEMTVESDDPEVAALITEHARSLPMLDPALGRTFSSDVHDFRMDITSTEKGITAIESTPNSAEVRALWKRAASLSQLLRSGAFEADRDAKLVAGDEVPPAEVAVGGVAHRVLLQQPDADALARLKAAGVARVVNFRESSEHPDYDEVTAASSAGLSYCNIGYRQPAHLTDEVISASRAALRDADAQHEAIALHCRTGNRVGPGWIAWRTLDCGVSLEQAVNEAKLMRMAMPLFESITRDYVRRQRAASAGAPADWTAVVSNAMDATQQDLRDRAVAARDAMFARLLLTLGEAMSKVGDDGVPVGPAGAIGVCKDEAPKIAQAIARERHVMIGRTSERLRNASNAAPRWAMPLISADGPKDAGGFPQPRFAMAGDGSFGAALPIRVSSTCVACHGPADRLDPKVVAALGKNYPNDRATGFKAGDLRGWFWVEVPGDERTAGERGAATK